MKNKFGLIIYSITTLFSIAWLALVTVPMSMDIKDGVSSVAILGSAIAVYLIGRDIRNNFNKNND
jgi:hypothetical protein